MTAATAAMTRLIDISPVISPRTAVFPQDTPFSREVLLDIARGDGITLSTMRSTVHLGSHADAPSHYGRDARTIDRQPLDLYVGPARVVRAEGTRGRAVTAADLAGKVPFGTERLVLATGSFPDADRWNDDFASIDPALVGWLATRGVRLLAVDVPSVDASASKDLPAHRAFLENDVAIIEGVRLDGVPECECELIALPLRIEGGDGSPVRAVLRLP